MSYSSFPTMFGWALLPAMVAAGCTPGYQTAGDLDRAHLGPNHCAKSCADLGMRMSALVLVESSAAGCVCEPVQGLPQAPYPQAPFPGPMNPAAPPGPALPAAPAPPGPAPGPSPWPPPSAPHSSLRGTGVAAVYVLVQAQRAAAAASRSVPQPTVRH